MIKFNDISSCFPANTFDSALANQLRLNLSNLTGKTVTLNSGIVLSLATWLKGLAEFTVSTNVSRAKANPPQQPISFVTESYQTVGGIQCLQYIVTIPLAKNVLASIDDPTDIFDGVTTTT